MSELTPEAEIKKRLFDVKKLLKECTQIADAHGIVFAYNPPNTDKWDPNGRKMKYLPEQPIEDYGYWRHSSKECGHTLEGPAMWITAFGDGFHSLKAVDIEADDE